MYYQNYSVRVFKANGQAANENNGYVSLINGEQYKLRLKNHDNRQCVCRVTIDGKVMGQFLVNANQHVDLERPEHDTGKFTFYTVDSVEGRQLQLATEVKPSDLGLISAEFVPIKPERPAYRPPFNTSAIRLNSMKKIDLSDEIDNAPVGLESMAFCSMDNGPDLSGWKPGMDLCDVQTSYTGGGKYRGSGAEYSAALPKRKAGGTGLSGESNVNYKQVHIDLDRYLWTEQATINLRLVAVESYETVRKLTSVPRATPVPPPV